MRKSKENCLNELVISLIPKTAVLTAAACVISLLLIGFDIKLVLGFAAGYAYMLASNFFTAGVMYAAVDKKAKKAQGMIMSCYFIRYAALLLLCAASIKFDLMNAFGILIVQFFPRIVLTYNNFREKKGKKHDASDDS